MYAFVVDGVVESVGRLPSSARRLDTGQWVMGLESAPTALVEACGWFPVSDIPPDYDPATEVRSRADVVVVSGVPTVEYSVRPKTQAELDADADELDREAKRVSVTQAVTWLRQQQQTAAGVNVTTTNAVNVLGQLVDNIGDFYGHFADFLEGYGFDQGGS